MKQILYFTFMLIMAFSSFCLGQDEESINSDSIEVFLIDSYVSSEKPYTLKLTFSTSERTVSKVLIMDKYEYDVSNKYSENHKIEIDISKIPLDSSVVPFIIKVQDSLGNQNLSERYEAALPEEYKIEPQGGGSSVLFNCCIGGTIFGLPSAAYVRMQKEDYFSLVKEIPIISIYSFEEKYPLGYFAVTYQHIFNAPARNFFKFGYKHIFPTNGIEFLSAGINAISNFNGYNGFNGEASVGWLNFYDVFTLYTKYSFNMKAGGNNQVFHSVSIGLLSHAFTLHLNL